MISKLANWIVWSALTLLVVVLVYKNTEWFKPAADKAMESVKTVVSRTPAGPFGKSSSEDQLNKARENFAMGDVDGSIAAYKEYVKHNSGNADARGEMGNVYYLTGKFQEAAQAYYDAAKLLIEQKQMDRVPALLPVIAQVNPNLADELSQKLYQTPMQQTTAQTLPDQQPQQAPQSANRYY